MQADPCSLPHETECSTLLRQSNQASAEKAARLVVEMARVAEMVGDWVAGVVEEEEEEVAMEAIRVTVRGEADSPATAQVEVAREAVSKGRDTKASGERLQP